MPSEPRWCFASSSPRPSYAWPSRDILQEFPTERCMTVPSTNPTSAGSDQQTIAEIMDGVRAVVRALRVNTRAIEKQMGISLAQLWVLQILDQGPAESLNELAVATATHQSS